jgi:hypothetical protein
MPHHGFAAGKQYRRNAKLGKIVQHCFCLLGSNIVKGFANPAVVVTMNTLQIAVPGYIPDHYRPSLRSFLRYYFAGFFTGTAFAIS